MKATALVSMFAVLMSCAATVPPAHADFDYLKEGQPAPYTGFLITPDRERSLRLMNETLKLNEALITQYERMDAISKKQIDVAQERLQVYQNENIRLSKEIVEARGDGFWNKFGYFALGVLATTLTVYGVSQALR